MIAQHHQDMLAASDITAEHAAARGYETIRDPRRLAELGIAKAGQRTQGLLVPELRVDGSTWGYQYRPDSPRERNGKVVKYETPVGQRNGIDVPPGVREKLGDPAVPLFITEGVKKADCGALHGLCIIALPGVWSWRGKNAAGGKVAVADWHDVALNNRRVILAFDGDVARKPSVQTALRNLADYLAGKGAGVEYLHLPDTDDKTGLDDYLAEHTIEDLWRLVKPTAPQTVSPKPAPVKPSAPKPKPPPEPVDGAELLSDIERFAGRFLAFPSAHHLVVIVLWIAHTWAVTAFYVTPRLVLDSPEPGSGKTRVLEVLALLCPNAKLTISTTTAALYRRIAKASIDDPAAVGGELVFAELLPTVLQDEADAIFGRTNNPQAEDLRALFNAGYKRGATVDRCEGDAKSMEVREFPVFAPVAFAGLAGKMPRTILDRSVVLHMRRRAPEEHIDEFRERDARADAFPLREKLVTWAWSDWKALRAMRPAMPEGVRDRPAEVWEALLAMAEFASGDWPERARAACRHFVLESDPDELSFGARLLRDVRVAFGERDRMFSVDVVTALTSDPESEWSDLWGKPLDQNRLAKELKRYGVQSKSIRIGDGRAKGYQVDGEDGLSQAWRRYVPDAPMRDKRDGRDIAGRGVSEACQRRDSRDTARESRDSRDAGVTPETVLEQQLFDGVTGVTAVTATGGNVAGNGQHDNAPAASCRFCDTELRLSSAQARGYCSRAHCLAAHQHEAAANDG